MTTTATNTIETRTAGKAAGLCSKQAHSSVQHGGSLSGNRDIRLNQYCADVVEALRRDPTRFWSKVLKTAGCWLWQGAKATRKHSRNGGYGSYRVLNHRIGAHKAAYYLTHDEPLNGRVVMHICDNPACVRPDHLRAGTHSENTRDSIAKGRAGFRWLKHSGSSCRKATGVQS